MILRSVFVGAFSIFALVAQSQTAHDRTDTLRQAAAYIQQGDLTSADNELQSLIKQTPDDPLALNLLGVVRMRQQKPDEAESLFHHAIQAGHKIAGPHINLALIYGNNRPLEALAELREALTIAPGDRQGVLLVTQISKDAALAAMKSGDKEKALEVLAKARSLLPQDPELLYDSGLFAYESGSFHEADQLLTKALQYQPGYPEATYALARTYLAESLAKPAEDQMRKYLSERPTDATAEYGLGYILMAEQRVGEAQAAFQRSLALQPDQTESVFQLGEIALQEGHDELAQDDFAKVLSRDPHHGGALTDVGILAYRAAKYEEAKTDLERAIENAPEFQKAHYYYALTLSRLGQKEHAEREFGVARSLQKEHGGEHHLPAAQP